MSLYLVATPIGNLGDLSQRAIETLQNVSEILCEDTRHSKKLLSHFEIKTPCTSFHSHTGPAKIEKLLTRLKQGEDLALISDAGTPGISDPAWALLKPAVDTGVNIVPIPGPAAFLAALMGSGLPMNEFTYHGFIPAKKGRQTLFTSLLESKRTVVFYESPHRIQKTLSQMLEILGEERKVVIARELTKLHESFHRGTLKELKEEFDGEKPKGEIVLLVAPANF